MPPVCAYVTVALCVCVCVCVRARVVTHTHTHTHTCAHRLFNVMCFYKLTCMYMCVNVMFIIYFIHLRGPFLAEAIGHRPLSTEVRVRT